MRFIETTADAIGEEPDYAPEVYKTKWWVDTSRPIAGHQKFIVVQTEYNKNPNDFIPISGLKLLFTDQAEYHAVCPSCYWNFKDEQWSGSTRDSAWRNKSDEYLKYHQDKKGWCEFCDPIFGNGGWV